MSTVDPICKHEKVVRRADNSWHCDWCEIEFFQFGLVDFGPGKIQTLEPYITVRDQFAMAAISGLLADPDVKAGGILSFDAAKLSYHVADAMLKVRSAEKSPTLESEYHRRGVKIIEMTEICGVHLCRAEKAEADIKTALELIPWRFRVIVREGAGPENNSASLAVSIAKLVREIERLEGAA